jgi:hypothetical protein
MSNKGFHNELARALARPDVEELLRILEIYRTWDLKSDEYRDEYDVVMYSPERDPDMAFAFIILGAASYDDEEFLGSLSAGVLEDLVRKPTEEILDRVVNEARKTPRFRWMLSVVYNHAIETLPAKLAVAKAVGDVNCDTDPLPPRPY